MEGKCVIIIVIITLLVEVVLAQKTFKRACDCEYTVDGKCAYTLLLPSANANGVCPKEGEKTELDEDAKSQLSSLSKKVEDLDKYTGEQAKLLTFIQGTLNNITSQESDDVSARIKKAEAAINSLTSQYEQLSSETTAKLEGAVSLYSTIEATVKSNSESIKQLLASFTDDRNPLKEVQILETKVNALNNSLHSLGRAMEMMSMAPGLCRRRGPLVSTIKDSALSASSSEPFLPEPLMVRINSTGAPFQNIPGAWCPVNKEPNDESEWVQFSFVPTGPTSSPPSGPAPAPGPSQRGVSIYGVVTRGRSDYEQWVTSYKLQYTSLYNGTATSWQTYRDPVGFEEIFEGNSDMNTVKTNLLWQPIMAQAVRIVPITGYKEQNKCMRVDVIGCLDHLQAATNDKS